MINIDASIFQGSSCFAIGMVARNHSGVFVGGLIMKFSRAVYVLEAKVMGIKEALSWVMSIWKRDVLVESDSLLAVQAINGNANYQLEISHTIEACRLELTYRDDVKVRHVRD